MTVAYEEQAQAVRTTAYALSCWTESIASATDRLSPVATWRGRAADTAAGAVERLRGQARHVAERPERGADVLRACAGELEQAAALQRRAAALTGGDATRLELEAAAVAAAALNRAAVALYDAQPVTTTQPHGLGRQLLGFGRGARDGLRRIYDLSQRMSPQRALVDPRGALRDRLDLARELVDDVQHPLSAVQTVAGVDQLRDGAYGEWLGGMVAGAVVPGGRAGRLENLGSRAVVRLVDKGGAVTVRIGLRLPRGYPVHINDLERDRRVHILDGDGPDRGGGHRSGTGKPGKTEFPASWSDDDIIERVMQTAMRPQTVVQEGNNTFKAIATHEGVVVHVIINRKGNVITAYPPPGSPGVVRNPWVGRDG